MMMRICRHPCKISGYEVEKTVMSKHMFANNKNPNPSPMEVDLEESHDVDMCAGEEDSIADHSRALEITGSLKDLKFGPMPWT